MPGLLSPRISFDCRPFVSPHPLCRTANRWKADGPIIRPTVPRKEDTYLTWTIFVYFIQASQRYAPRLLFGDAPLGFSQDETRCSLACAGLPVSKAREECALLPAALAFIDAREGTARVRARKRALFSPSRSILLFLPISSSRHFGNSRSSAATCDAFTRVPRCAWPSEYTRPREHPTEHKHPDKDASYRLYATAPFARVRFFQRPASSICRDFRPFPRRETARFRSLRPDG